MNWPTILIAGAVAAAFLAIIMTSIRNHRKGKASCSCGASCGGCPMGGKCHPKA